MNAEKWRNGGRKRVGKMWHAHSLSNILLSSLHSSTPRRSSILLSIAIALAGCQSAQNEHLKISDEDRTILSSAKPIRRGALPAAEGQPPLYLFVQGPGVLTVNIKNQPEPIVHTPVAPGRALVRIDAAKGVLISKNNVLAGPLSATQTYQVYFVGQ